MLKFNIGDTVRPTADGEWWGSVISPSKTYVVDGVRRSNNADYARVTGSNTFWRTSRFNLVSRALVEVGDTVEVTYPSGTVVTGIVGTAYSDGDIYIGTDIFIDNRKATVKILVKHVKPPHVWAVGDVVQGNDYESSGILLGTIISTYALGAGKGLVRVKGGWRGIDDDSFYDSSSFSSARTIKYVPES